MKLKLTLLPLLMIPLSIIAQKERFVLERIPINEEGIKALSKYVYDDFTFTDSSEIHAKCAYDIDFLEIIHKYDNLGKLETTENYDYGGELSSIEYYDTLKKLKQIELFDDGELYKIKHYGKDGKVEFVENLIPKKTRLVEEEFMIGAFGELSQKLSQNMRLNASKLQPYSKQNKKNQDVERGYINEKGDTIRSSKFYFNDNDLLVRGKFYRGGKIAETHNLIYDDENRKQRFIIKESDGTIRQDRRYVYKKISETIERVEIITQVQSRDIHVKQILYKEKGYLIKEYIIWTDNEVALTEYKYVKRD